MPLCATMTKDPRVFLAASSKNAAVLAASGFTNGAFLWLFPLLWDFFVGMTFFFFFLLCTISSFCRHTALLSRLCSGSMLFWCRFCPWWPFAFFMLPTWTSSFIDLPGPKKKKKKTKTPLPTLYFHISISSTPVWSYIQDVVFQIWFYKPFDEKAVRIIFFDRHDTCRSLCCGRFLLGNFESFRSFSSRLTSRSINSSRGSVFCSRQWVRGVPSREEVYVYQLFCCFRCGRWHLAQAPTTNTKERKLISNYLKS